MIRSTLKKILSMVTGSKSEPPRAAPATPAPRRPAPRVVEDEDEGEGQGHSHSHGHSHGRAPEPVAPPAPPPTPPPAAAEADHGHSHSHGHSHGRAPEPVAPPAPAKVTVHPEGTPNPNAMKFTVNRKVSPKGSFSFNSPAEAAANPLGKALFDISGVIGVFGVNDFITVTKDDAKPWDQLLAPVSEALKAIL